MAEHERKNAVISLCGRSSGGTRFIRISILAEATLILDEMFQMEVERIIHIILISFRFFLRADSGLYSIIMNYDNNHGLRNSQVKRQAGQSLININRYRAYRAV
jgi:hypothetical protein